jgi:hypothetical protein
VVRIVAPEGKYDLQNKYFTDVVKYHCPSGLPEAEEKDVQRLAVAAYRALGCRGWSRADLIIRAHDRKAFLIEMNTSPGMTSHSLVPIAARAVGLSYEALCAHLIATAALDPVGKGGKPAKNEQPTPEESMLLRQPATPTAAPASALPVDVRLMNAIAAIVFTLALVALAARGLGGRRAGRSSSSPTCASKATCSATA